MKYAKPLYIFDIQEWHHEESGFRKLPRYIVAIFPDNTDISKIKFSKKSRKRFKDNYELQIAKYHQFQDIIKINKQGKNHCRIRNDLYKWNTVSCNFDYGDTNSNSANKDKNKSGTIIKMSLKANTASISEYKSVYILEIKLNNEEPFFAAICDRWTDASCVAFLESTIFCFPNRHFKVVSGKIWERIASLCNRKIYRTRDGWNDYAWRELKEEEKARIRLIITGKEAGYIQKAKQAQNKTQEPKQKQLLKTVFNLDIILYVYVHYPFKYLHDYKMEAVHAGILCIDGEIRYIEAYYCQEKNFCLVSYYDYQRFQAQYGFILTKVYRAKNDSWNALLLGNESRFREQSELNLHGYNVGKKDNLSEQERHEILAGLLDYGIMNRYSIELYLQQFITLNGAKENMEEACWKWQRDYDFVAQYEIKDKRSILIKQIQSGSKNIIVENEL